MSSPDKSPTDYKNKNFSDSEVEEEKVHDDEHTKQERQDLFCVFTSERELRNIEQIRLKISQFTGITIKTGSVGDLSLINLLEAIEQDAILFQFQNKQRQAQLLQSGTQKSARLEMKGMEELFPTQNQTPISGVIHLRFEDVQFTTKAVSVLKVFLTKKQLIETLVLSKVDFQQPIADFKDLVGGMQFSIKLRKVGITNMYFDEEMHGKILGHLLNDCRTLREFDCSNCEFFHPKVFFDMCAAFIGDKCRVNILKLKGILITQLEGKIIQFVLMKNKLLHTIELSGSRVDNAENLEFFLQKLDKFSNIRCLTLDNIQPDMSPSLEILSEALSENTKLEVLIMRENKLKWVPYCSFWENLKHNTTLKKINVSKTDLSDRVLEKLCYILENPHLSLLELDLSRNQISDVGLAQLGTSLCSNRSIKFLNLSQNNFRDIGLRNFVTYLSSPDCPLLELSLMGNKINNDGMKFLAEFLRPNTSLKMLDIGRNAFGDAGFLQFAQEMGANCSLNYLDISKNKDLDDEGSLVLMVKALAQNRNLTTLDMSGLRVRKPFLKNHFEPALKFNCTLKYVIGKMPAGVIDVELKTNILIEQEVEPNFLRERMRGSQTFDVSMVDSQNTSCLIMSGKESNLFDAALKYVMYRDIRLVDFSEMGLGDSHLTQIASYLAENPNLRSITLDGNKNITNEGISRIADTLVKNNKLTHFSFKDCNQLSSEGLSSLNAVLIAENTSLFNIEFIERSFDPELSKSVRFQAQLNFAIQQYLKPVVRCNKPGSFKWPHGMHDKRHQAYRNVEEVEFCKEAVVSNYFSAAIKCWRIKQPLMIQVQDQMLQDQHIIELCNFLKDKNMITKLNLKRNKITNVGAKVIANWINDHDQVLVSIDLSRNKITRAGGEALLASLKRLTRILDFQISYGNPIPLTIQLAIASEVIANNQIKQNQSEEKKTKASKIAGRYELIDKGPNFMRCAIKSVELLSICHLSLPDNMLGNEEAKLIAAMIKMNPPLRTLNLEMNNLDSECAKLIAEALKFNSNLAILNISKNKLSDLGVNLLLRPLIKARIQQIASGKPQIMPQASPSQSNPQIQKDLRNSERVAADLKPASPASNDSKNNLQRQSDRSVIERNDLEVQNQEHLNTEEIEAVQLSQLKIINITDNSTTLESYKSIWTLLEINPEVVIYFDETLSKSEKKPSKEPSLRPIQSNKVVADDFKTEPESARTEQDHSMVRLNEEESEQVEVVQSAKKQNIGLFTRFLILICCFKSHQAGDSPPTLTQVLGTHLTASKRKALKYKPNIQKYKNIDRGSVQKPIQALITAIQLLLIPCAIIPIILDTQTSCELLAAYIGITLISELLIILCSKAVIPISVMNFFLYLQITCGILRKASLFGLSIFSGIGIRSRSLVGIIVGSIGFLSMFIEQVLIIRTLRAVRRVDLDAVHPNIESTQRLAEHLHFKGLNLIYQQITLMPSVESVRAAEIIAQDLNPDLIKTKPVGFMPVIQHFFVAQIITNEAGRHIFFIDMPLLVIGIICLAWTKLDLVFIVIFALLLVDTAVCFVQHLRPEIAINVDHETVCQISQQRKEQKASRYLEVLNRDVVVEEHHKVEEKPIHEDESSMFETKGSEFNTIQDFEPLRAVKASDNLKIKIDLDQVEQLDGLVFDHNGHKTEPLMRE